MDDLYPNDGSTYHDTVYNPEPPDEQTIKKAEADATVAASYPVIQDVRDWFDAAIENADRLSNVQLHEVVVNGVQYKSSVSIEAQVLAQHMLREALQAKRKEFDVEFK